MQLPPGNVGTATSQVPAAARGLRREGVVIPDAAFTFDLVPVLVTLVFERTRLLRSAPHPQPGPEGPPPRQPHISPLSPVPPQLNPPVLHVPAGTRRAIYGACERRPGEALGARPVLGTPL